jgi:response regulator RpfG family c-di-GMP phosphodiesterase
VIDRTRPRATVLVVDDERGPRESLRMILSPVYRVLAVGDGTEALEALRTTPVDVVTLDLAMPGLRGPELMRMIRSEFPDVELIVITGQGTLESATEGIRWGVADYLQKPFDVMQVTAAVYRALTRRRSRTRLVRFLEELGDVVGRDADVQSILERVEVNPDLRGRLGELLAKQVAESSPPSDVFDPDRVLPFFEVLAQAVEAQDPYQRGHGRRVAFFATLLADRLCLGADQKRAIRIGAFLHDIGKIGVPADVLARRGELSEPERRVVERHCEIGGRLLEPLGLGEEVVATVRFHHERWDGSGYPDGLAGDGIPLGGRIVQVADAFDAMTSDRPWRSARTQAAALAELRREAGRQFDPALAKEFAALVESGVCDVDLGLVAEAVGGAPVSKRFSAAPSALRNAW